MAPSERRIVRFGVFEVDRHTGELRKHGVRIKLQEKPFQLLLLLLDRQGDLVTREEVREALWPADTFVDFDHSLGTAVAKLRAALGDSAKNPRFVETVGGRGHRFIAPIVAPPEDAVPVVPVEAVPNVPDENLAVAPAEQTDIESTPAIAASERPRRVAASILAGLLAGAIVLAVVLGLDVGGAPASLRRYTNPAVRALAVLPLQNLSGDPAQEYIVDGMTEQLITTLAQLRGVEVISRTSAMQYKQTRKRLPEIGRELNVDAFVEGSVQRSGSRMRITVQLVDARTDQHLWAQSYDRDVGDVLSIENEIARSVANEIRVQLTPDQQHLLTRTHPAVPAAQEAYLRARYHFNKGEEAEIRKSIDAFNEAIALDPQDARSQAGLANAYVALSDFYERPSEMLPRARQAAERALKLDDSLADAHTALGVVRFLYDWNWSGAEDELKRATALNPASSDAHAWYGTFLAQMGRSQEALSEMQRAESLDPLSTSVHIGTGWALYLARRPDEAIVEWRKALEIEPHLGVAHVSIWQAYVQGNSKGAPLPAIHADPHDTSPLNLATLAGIYATSGQRAEAETILARLKELSNHRYICPYELAVAHEALGDHDEAFKWLQKGVEDRSTCMPDLKVDPRFDGLRGDSRFTQLLKAVGFE